MNNHPNHLHLSLWLASALVGAGAAETFTLTDPVIKDLLTNCGSCKVDLDCGWDLGHIGMPAGVYLKPWALSLRYDQFDQDRMNSGRSRIDLPPGATGIQHRNVTLDLDYHLTAQWTVSVSLPWVYRKQNEVEIDEDDPATRIEKRGRFSGIGDTRVDTQFLFDVAPAQRLGAVIGVKLPTGSTTKRTTETTITNDVVVDQGDEPTTWTLNPGNGSTDLIIGGILRGDLLEHTLVLFFRPQVQFALAHRDAFRPGNRFTVNAGGRWQPVRYVDISLQATGVILRRDSGERAEAEESGGEFLTVSPGISFYPLPDWQIYGNYLWQPYNRVNGEQFVVSQGFSFGTAARF
ncbi:hypothetical protein LBMAG53_00120 [Planctomycetota bacterium]|nr:hypothetical protein LBMAG53_00120 [Planctomycetota bacterium]